MQLIGLTGGIAAGKTTLAKILCALGACSIDLDDIYMKALAQTDTALLPDLPRKTPGGEIDWDNPKSRQRVFEEETIREQFKTILFPTAKKIIQKNIASFSQQHYSYCMIILPLMATPTIRNTGLGQHLEALVYLHCDLPQQCTQLTNRDKISKTDAMHLLTAKALPKESDIAQHADFVIHNTGDFGDLFEAAKTLHDTLCEHPKK